MSGPSKSEVTSDSNNIFAVHLDFYISTQISRRTNRHTDTYIQSDKHIYIQTNRHIATQTRADRQTDKHTCIQTDKHTYIQTDKYTYIQAYKHTYIQMDGRTPDERMDGRTTDDGRTTTHISRRTNRHPDTYIQTDKLSWICLIVHYLHPFASMQKNTVQIPKYVPPP